MMGCEALEARVAVSNQRSRPRNRETIATVWLAIIYAAPPVAASAAPKG